jgi:hypothetical protein
MNSQLDEAIRSVTADIVAHAPQPSATPSRPERPQRSETPWRRAVLAAALLLVVVGGLTTLSNRAQEAQVRSAPAVDPAIPEPPTVEATTDLATVPEISRDQWLVSAAPPAGSVFLYAETASSAGSRTVYYGPRNGTPNLSITIDTMNADVTGTSTVVNGVRWSLTEQPGSWDAATTVGGSIVRVHSSTVVDTYPDTLAGLSVVDTADLPAEPLDFEALPNEGATVATFILGDETLTLAATGQNNFYCVLRGAGGAGAGGCGERLNPSTEFASAVQQGSAYSDTPPTLTLEAAGIVASDVTRIEVDFINGETATTTPTDDSGTFEVRFWIAGAHMPLGTDQNPSPPNAIIEVRGYDDVGNLLYTQEPGSLGVAR